MQIINNIEPARVLYYFEEITKIPRCSSHEDKIASYLVEFAKSHNLESIRDEYNNVIIQKPGNHGKEENVPIILQGHMDMVCEKNQSSTIDFSKDGIKFDVEDGYIISKDTTLGADNGIAVAYILAILEDTNLVHGPIEALITSDEEVGMTGAMNLDGSLLRGKTLINLDSEEEGIACISCAGGQRNRVVFNKEFDSFKREKDIFKISISGLQGGHSGAEIHLGLGNSIKLLGRVLLQLRDTTGFSLIDIQGGSKSNAIPRDSYAIIALEKDIDRVFDTIKILNDTLKNEFSDKEPNINIAIEKMGETSKVLPDSLRDSIVNYINLAPNGVNTMSSNFEGLVESSTNLGVIESNDREFVFISQVRSSIESLKNEITSRNKLVATITNGEFIADHGYPSWEYVKDSPIRDLTSEVYYDLFGKELQLESIHAGLECGLFKEVIGNIDMISIGPNIYGVHAPGEKLDIESTDKVYKLLIKVLEKF